MAGNGRPFKRQLISRVPPNVPRDIEAAKRPPEYDPSQWYGVGAPRSAITGKPLPRTQVVFPPWIYPPAYAAQYFSPSAVADVAGVATVTLNAAACLFGSNSVFEVPAGNVAVIRSITLNVNALLAGSDITFTLLFNDSPVEGQVLRVFPRPVASAAVSYSPEETLIPVPQGAIISWRVNVSDANAYRLGVDYRGWFYSTDLANKFSEV